MNATG
jgi:hypothetical protein